MPIVGVKVFGFNGPALGGFWPKQVPMQFLRQLGELGKLNELN